LLAASAPDGQVAEMGKPPTRLFLSLSCIITPGGRISTIGDSRDRHALAGVGVRQRLFPSGPASPPWPLPVPVAKPSRFSLPTTNSPDSTKSNDEGEMRCNAGAGRGRGKRVVVARPPDGMGWDGKGQAVGSPAPRGEAHLGRSSVCLSPLPFQCSG
jgi:hypothetical protein